MCSVCSASISNLDHEDTSGYLVNLIITLFVTLEDHLFQFELLFDAFIEGWVWESIVGSSSVRATFVMHTVPNDHVALITRNRIAQREG